jgi:hypothetical protein
LRDKTKAAGSRFKGRIQADNLEVVGSVLLRDKSSFQDVLMPGAKIGGMLQLRDSDFQGHLNLTAVRIAEELHLSSPRAQNGRHTNNGNYPPPRWGKDARFTLRNAKISNLNDTRDSWEITEGNLDLSGFYYDGFGGLRTTKDGAMEYRSLEWMEGWLAKQSGYQTRYQPQPFEQLATVLRKSGYPGKADQILILARDHQLKSPSTTGWSWLLLFLQKYMIEYGYSNIFVVGWFSLVVLLGTLVSWKSSLHGEKNTSHFWFSFDMAVPLVDLNNDHEKVTLAGCAGYYFYFHKIFGFVLASFLAAGLSGLTK